MSNQTDDTPRSPVGDAPDFNPRTSGAETASAGPTQAEPAPMQVGNTPDDVSDAPPEHVRTVAPGNTHADEPYLGTDPVYQNHANDTESPLRTEVDDDSSEAVVMSAYVEEVAHRNFEAAQEQGANLGIQGFTVPARPEPPRTVEEIEAYEEDKQRRLDAAREEAAQHPAPRF